VNTNTNAEIIPGILDKASPDKNAYYRQLDTRLYKRAFTKGCARRLPGTDAKISAQRHK
jgi:hypothetical protein